MSSLSGGDEKAVWRERQTALLREIDDLRAEAQEDVDCLCRALVRLTQATAGLDPALDPHLVRLRELLKQGLPKGGLREELVAISNTLVRSEQPATLANTALPGADLLIRFLMLQANAQQKRALEIVLKRAQDGQLKGEQSLFKALRDILESAAVELNLEGKASSRSAMFGKIFGRNERTSQDEVIEIGRVRERLISLLEALEIPLYFRDRADAIMSRLRGELHPDDLQSVLSQAADFLGEVKSYIQHEQREIEAFLAVLTGKLIELEREAAGANAFTQESLQAREAAQASVDREFEGLKISASEAADLGQLRAVLTERIDAIARQLRETREQEVSRLRETDRQLSGLTRRLHDLERETNELRGKLRTAHDRALRDTLTGLPNRLAYEERIAQATAQWQRFGHQLALLVWDVDHFKRVNDRYGHAAGDRVLMAVGQTLAKSIRATDFVARFGGEEFVMMLTGADAEAAMQLANVIRERIEQCGFTSGGKPVPITVSCGIALFAGEDNPASVFERADEALYRAKEQGRNRCEFG